MAEGSQVLCCGSVQMRVFVEQKGGQLYGRSQICLTCFISTSWRPQSGRFCKAPKYMYY